MNIEKSIIVGALIRKARKKQSLDELVDETKQVITNAWDESVRSAATKAVNDLESVKGPASKEELVVLEQGVSGTLGQPLSTAEKLSLAEISSAAYESGMVTGAKEGAVQAVWNLPDKKSLAVIDNTTFYWVNSYYDDNLQEAFKVALQEYFNAGYTRAQLSTLLRVQFKDMVGKSDSYWGLLADHITTKTREIGRVSGYEQAGIEVVRVKAEIDKRTTRICLRLHGQVVAVRDLRSQVDGYLKACGTKNKDKIKKSWPWWSDKQADKKLGTQKGVNRAVKSGSVGLPPYHGRCRSITVAEFFADSGSRVLSGAKEKIINDLLAD